MAFKLGLNPFTHTLKTARQYHATAQILDQLGPAPSASPGYSGNADLQTSGNFGMDGNDQWGDCVFADVAHRIMVRTAQMGAGKMIVPTTAETLQLYNEVAGGGPATGNDPGGDLVTTAQYMQKTGMLVGGVRHTEDGNGVVDPTNIDHRKWSICLFGCAPLALNLPQCALDQFDADQPWDYVKGSPIVGGHDVLGVEYRSESLPSNPGWLVVTWGKRWPVTNAFMLNYLSEVVPVGAKDFITANGLAPSGVNLAQILQLLSQIN